MESVIRIVAWNEHYENNRTRELKKMQWVPMPNRHDGDGYTALLDHANGAAHFGAWCALVEVASRCDERGTLLRGGGRAHDITSLERITRIPAKVWKEVLPRLVSIGWIETYEIPQAGATMSQEGAGIPQAGAEECPMNGREGREGREGSAPHPLAAPPAEEKATPKKGQPTQSIDELKAGLWEVNPALVLSASEEDRLYDLSKRYGVQGVVDAYRRHQAKKPGKAIRWFIEDVAEWVRELPKAAEYPPQEPPPKRGPGDDAAVAAIAERARATIFRGAKTPAQDAEATKVDDTPEPAAVDPDDIF